MPDFPFKLEIVTPEGVVLSEDVTSVVAPGVEGYLGVLADHAPLMVELTVGEISVKDRHGKEICFATSGGFMQVKSNVVRILADAAERADDIDAGRAAEALRRAQERLKEREADVDRARAEAAMERALNRIRITQKD